MHPKFLSILITAALALNLNAQQPAAAPPQPLHAMPYSPSLDVTSMDKTIDPCVDFYAYSCGGWQKANPIPADQASWDVYAKLGTANEQFLWGILEEDSHATNRTPVQQKVGDDYAACSNTTSIDALGFQPVQPTLAFINSLTTRKDLLAAIPTLHHNLYDSFFSASTEQDAIDSDSMIAGVNAGGLSLPDRDYYLKHDAKSIKIREQFLAYVEQLLALAGESTADAKADATATLRIETALARAMLTRVQQRDPHATYHMMPLPRLAALTPAINWPIYLTTQQADPASPVITRLDVAQPAFMRALQLQLTSEPLAALRGYLRVHALNSSAPALAHPFEQAQFDFYSKTLSGIPAMPPRWKTCTRIVDATLGEALGQEFVARTFSADTRAKTQAMTEQIEAAMQQEIEGLTWMSPSTKAEALRKLHVIRNKIGYPATWRDYTRLEIKPDDFFGNSERAQHFEIARQWHKLGKPVDRNEWGMTPPTVNAYFDPQNNDINFPAGVLQPPLFDPKLDDAPNYGNTGSTIGHELTHAFDDSGRQYDSKGNLRDWWTSADAAGFETRINCLRDQYAGYIIVDDIHINSKLTSGEDVADLGGTLLAYIAWKKETAGLSLTNVDGFTPDQRYFIGMAQWACSNERPEQLRVRALTDEHSPDPIRVNGIVSNMPEFQQAFSCKAGQPMVHAPSCRVW